MVYSVTRKDYATVLLKFEPANFDYYNVQCADLYITVNYVRTGYKCL